MLEDFIEANNLDAKIIPLKHGSNEIKCVLFNSSKGWPVLLVALRNSKIDIEKLRKEMRDETLEEADDALTERITGYEKEFLPPISIYGVRVAIQQKLSQFKELLCKIDEEHSLIIKFEEIVNANEEVYKVEL